MARRRPGRSSVQSATQPSPQDFLADMGRLRISADQEFYRQLDRDAQEREDAHRAALEAAAAEHEQVRRSADVARQRFEHEIQKEIKRRQDDEAQVLDRIRQEKAEREINERKLEIERTRREEAQRRHIEQEALARAASHHQADEARRIAQQAQQRAQQLMEDKQRAQVAQDKQTQQARQARQAEQTQQAQPAVPAPSDPPTPPTATPTNGVPSGSRTPHGTSPEAPHDREAVHQEYRQIHQRLKQLRTFMDGHVKQNPGLKKRMGDMRREIRKRVGQCTEGKGANASLSNAIISLLKEASADPSSPQVDVRQFIFSSNLPPASSNNSNNNNFPGLLLYLLNIFSKAILAQFISEASVSPKSADPVGILAVQVFAQSDFHFQSVPLIDILIAKFHILCPVLWGIHGPEATSAGKSRLGWWRDGPTGPWIAEQRHSERMTGLGAGFAAIALRNFAKSKMQNPYPNWHYWQALHDVISVNAQEATATHFVVLKAMVEGHEGRFLELYGSAARAALRQALLVFPNQGGEGASSVAARAVATLPDVLRRDAKFTV